jgi:hypothetical protein
MIICGYSLVWGEGGCRYAVDRLTISLDRNRIRCIDDFTWTLQHGHMSNFQIDVRTLIRYSIETFRRMG